MQKHPTMKEFLLYFIAFELNMHSSLIVQNVKVYTVSHLPFYYLSGIGNV